MVPEIVWKEGKKYVENVPYDEWLVRELYNLRIDLNELNRRLTRKERSHPVPPLGLRGLV
jgi:hypothetical protein